MSKNINLHIYKTIVPVLSTIPNEINIELFYMFFTDFPICAEIAFFNAFIS